MTEDQFYRSLFPRLHCDSERIAVPPGDDCAAVRNFGTDLLLVAVDQLVGDRHYRVCGGAEADPPGAAGRKLLARNLSDIAAMGGQPEFAVTAIASSPAQSMQWLNAFMDGMLELAEEFGVSIIGGDMARTPHDDVSSLTILGRVREEDVVRRRGAQPGDGLYATGRFGASLATGHHLWFMPRCREGRWLAQQHLAHAMIDVSDGLLLDAVRLADASEVSLQIDPDALPLRDASLPTERALSDGEDYELLFAVPDDRAKQLISDWPFSGVPLTRIGRVTPRRARHSVTDTDNRPFELPHQGYDHFSDL